MNAFRRGLEILARNRVLRRNICVGDRNTALYVSPDAQLKYLIPGTKAFDQDLIAIARTFIAPTDCVWDVGANVGVFTFASSLVTTGTIVSIEADIWLAHIIRQSCGLSKNSSKDIRILPVAVSDQDGIAEFRIAARGRASSKLAASARTPLIGEARETQYVPVLTLDTILQTMPSPRFVKMDVEGAELMALSGAEKLISTVRPIFYIEIMAKLFKDIRNLFDGYNYQVIDTNGNEALDPTDANYFLIPIERQQAGMNLPLKKQ